jgi:large conductance mechanosensitive channel
VTNARQARLAARQTGEHLMLKEFQDFIAKGNVMDLAVGVIIGGAFGLIVKSLTGDIIMPIVGVVFGGLDFSNYFIPLSDSVTASTLEAAKEQGAVLAWGNFLTVALNFLILAWIIFLMVKSVNKLRSEAEERMKKEEEEKAEEPAKPAEDVALLMEIRDLLAKK